MHLGRIDLNLLVYLDVLLRERNVTKASQQLGISQPAMSNGLRRLRTLFNDPILVRTSEGMTPTERALELQPQVRSVLANIELFIQPTDAFDKSSSDRVFRIMASDYAEATLIPALLNRLKKEAPHIILDIMTPSDVGFHDVEQGKVDMVINRFESMPLSFHQSTVWRDNFSCVMRKEHPACRQLTLENYIKSEHVWVSKTGMGIGVGINPKDVQKLGWIDEALSKIGEQRRISVFTRHFQAAMQLTEHNDLIATVPTKATHLMAKNDNIVVLPAPFEIPAIELKIAWSPLLQHNPGHRWMRHLIQEVAKDITQ